MDSEIKIVFTQQKIADLVRQSYEARKKAKQLLEEAKRQVEKLIDSSPQNRRFYGGGREINYR